MRGQDVPTPLFPFFVRPNEQVHKRRYSAVRLNAGKTHCLTSPTIPATRRPTRPRTRVRHAHEAAHCALSLSGGLSCIGAVTVGAVTSLPYE